ncbi:MAG: 30S ribosomal protein S1 [Cyanobacteria bacterium]|uniref:S1 RNA-binding domain-containing protein n=1 Tax=Geminocystis sp. TaxID=2664100 RepID=UPI001D5E245B|nr:30S ribosomal protein S1 [Cyanobacteria bacterium CG_2015-16_32_12]NCO78345.1 30S ribosomal protein S1 [Cyanobacteria bacterium CG_2015-22_32_23]NCQ05322.1 30S ribosomal protein S1 [Cyanobacteria bacterium CG_2015-09_32_10]NCQ41204.1 30S ribosomal protein S1 [Cyanobacteria bacterium CG_2015-04_32_10]NCS83768.1 30S ribosomal protein S1 [Cyanobacteria bacterium CG_2015-02_32_10]
MTANSNPSEQQISPFSMDDFAQALEQEQYDYHFNKGEIVKGKVFQHDSSGVYVDIGGKSPGFVPLSEASWQHFSDVGEVLPLQEEFEFLIIKEQDSEGQVKLSRRQLFIEQAWDNLTEIQEKGKVVQMLVTGVNRGGVIGQIDGLRAFIPRSHLIEKDNFDNLIDQSLPANVLQIDRAQNKIVLTQRDLAKTAAMSTLQENEVIQGKVVKIQPYGVFIDFGGIAGLLHIKQISEAQISSLNTLFKIGEEIKVVVLEIDETKNRISLSTKVLETYPGEFMEKKDLIFATAEERLANKKAKNN